MKYLRKFFGLAALALMTATSLSVRAQGLTSQDLYLESSSLERNGNLMSVVLDLDVADLNLKSNQAVIYTPMIVSGNDTLNLTSVGVYGKTAWVQYQRGILKTVSREAQIPVKYSKKQDSYTYSQNVDFQEWMRGSGLIVKRDFYGCASCKEGEAMSEQLVAYTEAGAFQPQLAYQAVIDEGVKMRELSGRAFVDFPVNKIVIYPEYRNNTYELGKIIATIDSVKNDPDITVTSIHIAGTASPEGPYDNNVYLAKNRTIALKDYVTNLYKFPKDFIQTDYDPVDWKGLREWLENNNINHKEQILAIVNSDIEDYARNSKIKKDFPAEYEWLHRNVYPALRHSDYRIEYQIRGYTDVVEIAEILRTKPQKLSLAEMYRLAASLEPGSPDYNEVFEVAVRLYPEDPAANLNAANNALSRGELQKAEQYLSKAGNSPEAIYARGILKGMQGNYSEAVSLIRQAQAAGLNNTESMLEYFQKYAK